MPRQVYNFSAGPAMLPRRVLLQAQRELTDYRGTGMSVMELSHRGSEFEDIYARAVSDLRTLLDIPPDYEVLFLQGGATLQFSVVPMNLMGREGADYLVTGLWSRKALQEAKKLGDARCAATGEAGSFTSLPEISAIRDRASYVYLCENETVQGIAFPSLPDVGGRPLVVDQSSIFLARPCRISDYGLLFAGVQKNAGPAGLTVVILKKSLLGLKENLPAYLDYRLHAAHRSMLNTPNCWAVYVSGLVFRDLLEQGGVEAAWERNRHKSALLYDYLDGSRLFHGIAGKDCRSPVNVTFTTGNGALDALAAEFCQKAGFLNLSGHRSVGGLRASLYNAMPAEGVRALIDRLYTFEKENPPSC